MAKMTPSLKKNKDTVDDDDDGSEKSGGSAPVEGGVLESIVAPENRHFKDPPKVT